MHYNIKLQKNKKNVICDVDHRLFFEQNLNFISET